MKKILLSLLKNVWNALIYGLKAAYYGVQTKNFWLSIPKFLFVKLFWYGLASTVIFLLMIPAMKSGQVPIWLAIVGSLLIGVLANVLSGTYDSAVRTFRKDK